jgi:tetratricopeptide (TPR) repeat protein
MIKIKRITACLLLALASTTSIHALAGPSGDVTQNAPSSKVKPEYIYKYLLGEIAGQRGDPALACQLFLDLAEETQDPRLAERAAKVAAFANQPSVALRAASLWAKLAPSSIEAQQAASQMLVASGNLKDAKPHIHQLLTKEDTRANGFLYLNSLLANQKDKTEVLNAITEFAAPYPKLAEAHFAIAQAAWFANKPELASKELNTASKLRPDWEPAAQMQGQMLLKESPEKAVDFYKAYLKKNPKANEVRLSYAKLLVNQKRFAEAKPEFVKLVDASNNNADINAVVGLLSLESDDYVMADKYFQQALNAGFKDPDQVYLYLGRSAEKQKLDTKALAFYNNVKQGDRYLEGKISAANLIARTESVDAAIKMLDEVEDLTPEQQMIIIQTEASLLSQAKRNQESFDLLQKATDNNPSAIGIIYDHAMAAERVNKLDVMEAQLRKLIQMKPDYAAAYNALGYSFADRNINLEEAKTLIETAVKLQPNDHYMLDSLGWVHYRLGNLALAVDYLKQAYQIQADPEIAAHLGEVLWKQGQQEEAKKVWANALKAFPDNDTLVSTTKKFKFNS